MTEYKPGDIANGYQWTGTQWVPVPKRPEMPFDQWIMFAVVGVALLAGLVMLFVLTGGFR